MHGAAKVGDIIANSETLKEKFDCHFITIKSSENIGDIGSINFRKILLTLEIYFKVLCSLLIFRPDKIYYTASIKSVAFYRDLFLSCSWKLFRKLKSCDIYYHYHTKGIDQFVSSSTINLWLTRFFVHDINLILLSNQM